MKDANLSPPRTQTKESQRVVHVGIWGVSQIRGTTMGVPQIRTIVFWGDIGSPYFENYH